jgi:hypothetical protein
MFRARSMDCVRSKPGFLFVSLATWLAACSGASDNGFFQNAGGSGGPDSGNGGATSSNGGALSLGGAATGGALNPSGGALTGGASTSEEGGVGVGGDASSGGAATFGGAAALGGASFGGALPGNGGANDALGGAPAAGASSGGSAQGGIVNSGGAEAGGNAGGASAQGGITSGGTSGGTSAGGTASGGAENGGINAGGASGGIGGTIGAGAGGGSGTGGGATCQKGTEICDGVDNDCNDQIDEKACPAKCTGFVAAGRRYMACATSVIQSSAASTCEKQGMRLAWIDSADKASALLTALQELGSQGPGSGFTELYMGATDAEQEGHWHWIGGSNFWLGNAGGSPVDGAFANWSKNRPNNYPPVPGENCAVTIVDYPSDGDPGQWNDVPCAELHGVLCELP